MLCVRFGVAWVYQTEYLYGTAARVSDFLTRPASLTNFVTAGDANINSEFLQVSKKGLRTSGFCLCLA